MKDDEKRSVLTLFIICLLLLIFVFLIEIITTPKAYAIEVVNPSSQVNRGNTTYYGYDLPTRPTNLDNNSQSRVNLGFSSYFTSSYKNIFVYSEKLYLRDLDNTALALMGDINFNLPKVWTRNINFFDNYFDLNYLNEYYFSYGFAPGGAINNDTTMFENGNTIYYNGLYSYDYDIIAYNTSGISDIINPNQQLCNVQNLGGNVSFSCSNSHFTLTYDVLVNNDYVKYYRFHVLFNANSRDFGFNQAMINDDSNIFGVDGNNILVNYKNIGVGLHQTSDTYVFSEPYNIKYWSTETSYTCSDKCWTQQDTDENQLIYQLDNYLFESMSGLVDNFEYYGFSGIVHLTYDFIIDVLSEANTSCNELTIPVLSTSFNLPSACTFWNRNDITSFKSFYEMFWLGIVSFYLGWKIYHDILELYTPGGKVIGNEVADL